MKWLLIIAGIIGSPSAYSLCKTSSECNGVNEVCVKSYKEAPFGECKGATPTYQYGKVEGQCAGDYECKGLDKCLKNPGSTFGRCGPK